MTVKVVQILFPTILISLTLLTSCSRDSKLQATLSRHLAALEQRDMTTLLTIVDRNNITEINLKGHYLSGFQEYRKEKEAWFSDPGWNLKYDVLHVDRYKKTAVAMVKMTLRDRDDRGGFFTYQYYSTLIFHYKPRQWKMTHCQNTIIRG
ncbi:MAG: nuclear transport factor 2 family protein [Candidatus Marinimicrobia bacterium]|nr:nuclear transport factor 2 family protein [Candidatus Neomarinimicrobiota bacterium]